MLWNQRLPPCNALTDLIFVSLVYTFCHLVALLPAGIAIPLVTVSIACLAGIRASLCTQGLTHKQHARIYGKSSLLKLSCYTASRSHTVLSTTAYTQLVTTSCNM